jgi:hypothetical protein
MQYTDVLEKKGIDAQVAQLEQLITDYQSQVDKLKNSLTIWEGTENEDTEATEVDTSNGKMVVNPGDFVMVSPAVTVVISSLMINDSNYWVPYVPE